MRGRGLYRSVILLPYAIAPVIAGILWAFMFNAHVGPLTYVLKAMGVRLPREREAETQKRLAAEMKDALLRRRLEPHGFAFHDFGYASVTGSLRANAVRASVPTMVGTIRAMPIFMPTG